jgi:hypothetical protein
VVEESLGFESVVGGNAYMGGMLRIPKCTIWIQK